MNLFVFKVCLLYLCLVMGSESGGFSVGVISSGPCASSPGNKVTPQTRTFPLRMRPSPVFVHLELDQKNIPTATQQDCHLGQGIYFPVPQFSHL